MGRTTPRRATPRSPERSLSFLPEGRGTAELHGSARVDDLSRSGKGAGDYAGESLRSCEMDCPAGGEEHAEGGRGSGTDSTGSGACSMT